MIVPGYKTTIRKIGNRWRVFYYFPYSGFLCDDWPTWERAMEQTWAIEEQRLWV